ncbi:MAG: MSHA biogenesis protein MshE, partial [Candidatus Omnitrophota bacterium]|nr:MSHA biogenesis protein MshE [Candidatus Omnitrophota bacterium]
MAKKIEIADLLLREGMITPDTLVKAQEEIKRTGLSIERALEKLGFITEEDIAKVKAAALGLPYLDLSDYIIDAELTTLIPENMAKK